MPKKKKTNHQLQQIKQNRQYEAVNVRAKKVLEEWAKKLEYRK